jgi:galactose mutarotase-like enzyme
VVHLFGEELSRRELLRRVGSIDQIAGVRKVRLEDGPEDGVSAVEVRTGGGLSYTVLLSRALDVAAAELDGTPLAWRSGAGDVHPAYTHRTLGWNHGWFGGLLATCGLDNFGGPGEDELGPFAQHGHVNGVPARYVSYGARWQDPADGRNDSRYVMWVEGELRQKDGWMPGSYDVVLRRRIESELGGRTIAIADEVENLGRTPAPLMLTYHVNFGWPLVAPGAEILSRRSELTSLHGEPPAEGPLGVGPPAPDYRNNNFGHAMLPNADGFAEAALVNDRLGVGVAVRYRAAELPFFNQWKQLIDGRYVVSLEPLNSRGGNRARAREHGVLPMLEPGEVRSFRVDLIALRGADELAARRVLL